jgi:hypothetical protein
MGLAGRARMLLASKPSGRRMLPMGAMVGGRQGEARSGAGLGGLGLCC